MELDLGCVAAFLVVLEEGSYRRAAGRLHVSGSALSRRIQRLERQVGVTLLVRGPAGTVGATAAGLSFAAEAGLLLAAARAARAAARAAAPPAVRLGIPGGLASLPSRAVLTEVRRRFEARAPGVRLLAVPLPFPGMYTALLDGAVDVLWGAVGSTPAPMEVAPAGGFDRVAVLPVHHPLADAERLSAADLVDLPLQTNPAVPRGWMAPYYLGDVRPARQARLVEVDAPAAPVVFEWVLRGDAVTVTAAWFSRHLHAGLRAVMIDDLPPVQLLVARRRDDRRGPVLALVDSMTSAAAPRPGSTTS